MSRLVPDTQRKEKSQHPRKRCSGEIDDAVGYEAAPLNRRAENAVHQISRHCRTERDAGSRSCRRSQVRTLLRQDDGRENSRQASTHRDAAIFSRGNRAQSRDHIGLARKPLSDFARSGVARGFGERCDQRNQKRAFVRSRDDEQRKERARQ